MFTFQDTRYSRQEQMPEWGAEKQRLLSKARVVVIGAGGVKSTLLLALVAAGVGHLRVIEHDRVELSNLNRQILYRTSSIGKFKADECRDILTDLNPEIEVEVIKEKLDSSNIAELCSPYEFVVEGGDSPAARNLVNEYCLKSKTPFTHASAQFSYGYVFSVIPEQKTSCFACFFPNDHFRTEHTGPVPVNVLATSVAGSLGAAEVLKWFMGYKHAMLLNRRLCFSSLLLSGEFSFEEREPLVNCAICSKYYQSL